MVGASQQFGSRGHSSWITSIPNVCHISFQPKQNIYTQPGSPSGHLAIASWERLRFCKPRSARVQGISSSLQNKQCGRQADTAQGWAPGRWVMNGCSGSKMRRGWSRAGGCPAKSGAWGEWVRVAMNGAGPGVREDRFAEPRQM